MYIDLQKAWLVILLIISTINTIKIIYSGEKWYSVLTVFFGGWWLAKLIYGLN